MRVSVAMTIYNGQAYLNEQLDSIKDQTKNVDEVIICDDRSSDKSYDLVADYIRTNQLSHWKLLLNEVNLGYANNFRYAVRQTTGDLIFFCDQDDIWIPNRVEMMVEIMESNPSILMLGSEFEPFSSSEDAPSISKSVMRSMTNDQSLEKISLNHKTIFIGSEGCTMCVRKTLFDKTFSYWFDGWAHDEYVWKMALVLNGCYIFHGTTLLRRLHSNNVSKRKMRDVAKRVRFLDDLKRSHEVTLAYYMTFGKDTKLIDLFKKNIKVAHLRSELLSKKKIINAVKLLPMFRYYHSVKSIPVEIIMSSFQW